MNFEVKTIKDIEKLRFFHNKFDCVTIHTKKIKYRGVLHYAIKYAAWSLKKKATLLIKDNGPYEVVIRPYLISIYQVNQCVHQFLKANVKPIKTDFDNGTLEYEVNILNSNNQDKGWSSGIIYSGSSSEVELLNKSIIGLYNQEEFNKSNSEIVVCGPSNGDYSFLSEHPNSLRVIYVDDVSKDGRFLISKKKNILINNLKYENCILIHSRIQFEPNTLKNLNTNFEFISPQINIIEGDIKKRYIDFNHMGSYDPTRITVGKIVSSNYKPYNYLNKLKYGQVYIDGGCMIFKRSILMKIPLNNNLAWFENEDVELASRLQNGGYLIDYAYNVLAISNTNKTKGNPYKKILSKIYFLQILLLFYIYIKSFFVNYYNRLTYFLFK
jgi:hypothetical protein